MAPCLMQQSCRDNLTAFSTKAKLLHNFLSENHSVRSTANATIAGRLLLLTNSRTSCRKVEALDCVVAVVVVGVVVVAVVVVLVVIYY